MKLIISALLFAVSSHAAEGEIPGLGELGVSKTDIPVSANPSAAQGFRVALIKPVLATGIEGTSTKVYPSTFGISLGIVQLPVRRLGYAAQIAAIGFDDPLYAGTFLRAEGSVAYAVNPMIYFKAGLNSSNLTSSSNVEVNPGIGYQAMLGFQLTPRMGAEVGYMRMSQQAKSKTSSGRLKSEGPELSLHATF